MLILKKLLVLLTVWAYVLQASAAVSLEDCRHTNGEMDASRVQVSAESPPAAHHDHAAMLRAMAEGHEHHMAGMAHVEMPPDSAVASAHAGVHDGHADASASSSDCCSCDCQCGSHGCSSPAPGVALSRAALDVDNVSGQIPAQPVASPLQAHTFGLIRPPSIS